MDGPAGTGLAPETCSCSALRQATRHVSRAYDDALRPVGLSLNQYSILIKLKRSGPMSIQDLAALLVMDRSTLGHLLRPLSARALIVMQADENDRRTRVVSLTAEGEALVDQAQPLWARAEARFAEVFGADDATELRATLRRITRTDLGAS